MDTGSDTDAGLTLHTRLALRWQPADTGDTGGAAPLETHNLRVLHDIMLLDDLLQGSADDLGGPLGGGDLQRIERKLDLLIVLLQVALSRDAPQPHVRPLSLTPQRISWQAEASDSLPAPRQAVCVQLHLNAGYPAALCLTGQVRSVVQDGAGQRVDVELDAPGEAVQDSLERYLFRQHRRLVAAQRRAGSSPGDG